MKKEDPISNEVASIKSEVAQLLNKSQVEEALILLTEKYMLYDNRLRKAINAKKPLDEIRPILSAVIKIGHSMNPLLTLSGCEIQAVTCGMNALFLSSSFNLVLDMADDLSLSLLQTLDAIELAVKDFPQDDSFYAQHIPVILSYLASILYALYAGINKQTKEAALIYNKLKLYKEMNAIQSPVVNTPSGPCDPLHPVEIVNDLAGRAIAIDLLVVD